MALTRSLPTARGALAPLRLRPSPCALRGSVPSNLSKGVHFTRFGYSAAHVVANPFAAEIFSMLDRWQRPGDEVLATCIERYKRCV